MLVVIDLANISMFREFYFSLVSFVIFVSLKLIKYLIIYNCKTIIII